MCVGGDGIVRGGGVQCGVLVGESSGGCCDGSDSDSDGGGGRLRPDDDGTGSGRPEVGEAGSDGGCAVYEPDGGGGGGGRDDEPRPSGVTGGPVWRRG